MLQPRRIELVALDDEYVAEISVEQVSEWLAIYQMHPRNRHLFVLFAHALELYSHLLEPMILLLSQTSGDEAAEVRERTEQQVVAAQERAAYYLDHWDDLMRLSYFQFDMYLIDTLEALNIDTTYDFIDDVLHEGNLFYDNLWSATRYIIGNPHPNQDEFLYPQPVHFIAETLTAMMTMVANPHIVWDRRSLADLSQEEVDALRHPLTLEEAERRVNQWLNTWWLQGAKSMSFVEPF